MKEDHNCNLCSLSQTVTKGSVCLKGRGCKDSALLIFLDAPGFVEDRRGKSFVSDVSAYLDHLMKTMSINQDDYYLEYILKCYPKPDKTYGKKPYRLKMIEVCSRYRFATLQVIKPKAIVCAGPRACEAILGSEKVGNFEGEKWTPREPTIREYVNHVWVTYNPAYGLEDIGETVGIYRTLFHAAIDAGLKPKFNADVKKYDYGT